jgi:tRNA pseudouridine38-40 synthase
MRNIKLILAYEGTSFHGWQIQPGVPTIQGALADAAGKITEEQVHIEGASRTDTGVHALGQVASFRTRSQLPAAEMQRALNALLPHSIRVVSAEEVAPDFHPRWNAQSKVYHYRIFRGAVLPPFEYGRAHHHPWPLDEDAMIAAAPLFAGERDFSSFAASSGSGERDENRNPIRAVINSRIIQRKAPSAAGCVESSSTAGAFDELLYVIHGKSFLRYMVRKIVGTLLEVGRGRIVPERIPEIFALKDRTRSGPTAGPEGLYLVSIEYPDPLAADWLRDPAPDQAPLLDSRKRFT